jgi:hypothetical protein
LSQGTGEEEKLAWPGKIFMESAAGIGLSGLFSANQFGRVIALGRSDEVARIRAISR